MWYRRGWLNLKSDKIISYNEDTKISQQFNSFLIYEKTGLVNFIHYALIDKKHINNYLFSKVNKLMVLKKAIEIGLIVPPTIITGEKTKLIEFKKKHGALITKTAIEGLFFGSDNFWISSYTEPITDELIKNLDELFFPSLFQLEIQKLFELRVFYIEKELFSMAIFSQSNEKTQVDFRHYGLDKPNRNVPFKMPLELKNKIIKLMEANRLNSGSLDFIYSVDKKFYFLEINPIGQFGMTSYPCNYFLEQLIANKLKKNEN